MSNGRMPEILVIEDDAAVQKTLCTVLSAGYTVKLASSGEEGLHKCETGPPDLVLLDLMLPQMGGLSVLRCLKKAYLDLPVIMMTAFAQVGSAVEAIKLGAADYLEKPFNPVHLLDEIDQIVATRKRTQTAARHGIVGESSAMAQVWRLVERFGPTDIPVLLQGETGTGKGMFANALHEVSKRARGPFIHIDCSTIPEQLAESELFGYEDGAFTGAGKKKPGKVMFADRGTLFLDEIGVLGLSSQAKLLTLIEQQGFIPLGSRDARIRRLDARFIAATNVPLYQAAESGSFRGDLYHRLNGITIDLPPLRDRGDDVVLLAENFLVVSRLRYGKPNLEFSAGALDAIREYSWPGNVRELQRAISAAVIMANETILADDLPENVRRASTDHRHPVPPERAQEDPLPGKFAAAAGSASVIDLGRFKEWVGREAQRRVIEELQRRTKANHQELARMLRIDPKTLRARLKNDTDPDVW